MALDERLKYDIFFYSNRFCIHLLSCNAINFYYIKPLFNSSQKPTCKIAVSVFKCCDCDEVLAATLQVSFCDE